MRLNKKFTLLSLTILAAATLAGPFASNSFALTAGTNPNDSTDTQYGVSKDGVSDGTLAIYPKTDPYAESNSSKGENDGKDIPDLDTGATLGNITFIATPIVKAAGSNLQIDASDKNSYTTDSSRTIETASGVPENDELGVTGHPAIFTNDSNLLKGSTNGLKDGYYLIHQQTTGSGIRATDDFIIYVNDSDTQAGILNAYPKEDLTIEQTLTDTATTNASPVGQFAGGQQAGSPNAVTAPAADNYATNGTTYTGIDTSSTDGHNTTTAGAGNNVTFNLNTQFTSGQLAGDSSLTTYNPIFEATDVLPSGWGSYALTTDENGNHPNIVVSYTTYDKSQDTRC